ncbi:MAG: DNA adenine methylase [Candidatus Nanopelagicales bacterium]
MIKYLGSKRRLVPVLGAMAAAAGARTAVDLFSGTARVSRELKARGVHVTAVDSARYAAVLAQALVATDGRGVDADRLARALRHLASLPPADGYVTETFSRRARFFQPHNAARIDAIREGIAREFSGDPLEPVLLAALLLAADRVDSTTGVQMAYLKTWARRSYADLDLRVPPLLPGSGRAVLGDATTWASAVGPVDLAYVDPPYNQHRYTANYHVWETLVAWDAPEHYGVACKRGDLREPHGRSAFNSRRTMPAALRAVIEDLHADVVVVSHNDESWVGADEIAAWCGAYGEVAVLDVPSRRYVGSRIGIHDRNGVRVGTPGRSHNVEHLVVAGPGATVSAMVSAAVDAAAEAGVRVSVGVPVAG